MKEKFDFLLNNYLLDSSLFVDSSKEYYHKFVNELPIDLKRYFNETEYLIKASCGNGQRSEIPWLCIFNRSVTTSATQGIYICYLFKKDMSGFYLVLGQGITTFELAFGKNKYINIRKVANYFKDLVNDNRFSKDEIHLNGTKNLAKGYEAGTIISKYYEKNQYTEKSLIDDLSNMKKIYDDICYNLKDFSYMDVVDSIVSNMDPTYIIAEEANKLIEEALLKESGKEEAYIVTLEKVDIPKPAQKNRYSEITRKTIRKIDYLKKTITNADIGLIGEELVMAYEKDKLESQGREDLANKIKWISKENDGTGYDIISYDIDKDGKERQIYIEVKSTEGSIKNNFFISSNEVDVMEKLKEKYFLYRVYDVKTKQPKFFILSYDEFKTKIDLKVENYQASLIGE